MDCFDTHYYWLNRKLLTIIGQWPYQNHAERVRKWILFFGVIVATFIGQVGRTINVEVDFELCIEFVSESIVTVLISIRYYSYTINNDKIKVLLDSIRLHWQTFSETDEHEIICDSAEEARLYISHYTIIVSCMILSCILGLLASPLSIYTPLTNVSCPILMMFVPHYVINPQQYCYPMLVGISFVLATLFAGCIATDLLYIAVLHHAVAMFRVVCYRLEHSFDNCTEARKASSSRTYVCERIARAVECHRTAIRFGDNIVAAYEWSNLISLALGLLSIAIGLYWAVTVKGQIIKWLFAMSLSIAQINHLFILVIPAQKMIDNSGAVILKAYSGLWYMGRAKEQTLLLLTMQRGLKPSAMVIGRMYPATLENFATEIKASFSYFTVLMSIK